MPEAQAHRVRQPAGQAREKTVLLRFSVEEKRRLKRAAQTEGVQFAVWAREKLLRGTKP